MKPLLCGIVLTLGFALVYYRYKTKIRLETEARKRRAIELEAKYN